MVHFPAIFGLEEHTRVETLMNGDAMAKIDGDVRHGNQDQRYSEWQ